MESPRTDVDPVRAEKFGAKGIIKAPMRDMQFQSMLISPAPMNVGSACGKTSTAIP